MVPSNQTNSQWDFDAPRYRDFSQVHGESSQSDTWLANRLENNPRPPRSIPQPNTFFKRATQAPIKRPSGITAKVPRDPPSIHTPSQPDSNYTEPHSPIRKALIQREPQRSSPIAKPNPQKNIDKSKAKPSILAGPFTLSQPLSTSSSTATERYVPNRPPTPADKGKGKEKGVEKGNEQHDYKSENYSISQPMQDTQGISWSATSPNPPQKPSLGPTKYSTSEPPKDVYEEKSIKKRSFEESVEVNPSPLKQAKTHQTNDSAPKTHYMPRFPASKNSTVRSQERLKPGTSSKKYFTIPKKSIQRDSPLKEKPGSPISKNHVAPEKRIATISTMVKETKPLTETARKGVAPYVPRFARLTTPNSSEKNEHEPNTDNPQASFSLSKEIHKQTPPIQEVSAKEPPKPPLLNPQEQIAVKTPGQSNPKEVKSIKPTVQHAQRIPSQQSRLLSRPTSSNPTVKKSFASVVPPPSHPISKRKPDTLYRSHSKPSEDGYVEKIKTALFSDDIFKKQLEKKQHEIKSKQVPSTLKSTVPRLDKVKATPTNATTSEPFSIKDSFSNTIKSTILQHMHQTPSKSHPHEPNALYSHPLSTTNTTRKNEQPLIKEKEPEIYTNSIQRKEDLDEIFKGMETIRMELQNAQEATQHIVNKEPLEVEYTQLRSEKRPSIEEFIEDKTQRALRVIAESKRRSRHWESIITSPTPITRRVTVVPLQEKKETTGRYSQMYTSGQNYKSPYLPIEPTVAKSPVFATDSRMYLPSRMEIDHSDDYSSKQSTNVKPARRKTFSFDGPLDLPPPKRPRLTIPQSPEFLTDQRPPRKSYLDHETKQLNINNRYRRSSPSLRTHNKRETTASNQRTGLFAKTNYDGSSFRERLEVWKNRARQEELANASFSSML
ncbi:hypothetical protein J3Q64DRAFT_1825695 [Phycomyces blakesleeanus]|uniref:Uncharacterized protein n=2 Tax=Phycomyces blakesleeanus TaxID=4837 RepID=A0A162TX49_PHYB8|nr:hypothetical protein PHYBLDRAFT_69968 [Phycomyces blakesleeanus NRRL 1555(-)]OAD71692.1 hypothetical protein PHYBLDRAFT_69968 [Phycomyces blakesleeanus NRRL 1555(-)]|eukprot:XP_018289732.1 hypothetical protein PHYBLDRAFT_69968 [Phycomyces blakesleeanus NRRL 1555(-)]